VVTGRRLVGALACGLLVLAASSAPAWLPAVGEFLVVDQPPQPADAIIVLAGNAPERLRHAESLYDAGLAPLLVVSDEEVRSQTLDTTWTALYRAGVVARSLPPGALIVVGDPPPDSTLDEATRVAALMQDRGLRSALLVTDPFHSRRASLLFGAAFRRRGLELRTSPGPDELDLPHWWTHAYSARMVVEEYAKLLSYLVQGRYW
jgi:uncharacterized SAM-binding protein YcdF (DUF218 family)